MGAVEVGSMCALTSGTESAIREVGNDASSEGPIFERGGGGRRFGVGVRGARVRRLNWARGIKKAFTSSDDDGFNPVVPLLVSETNSSSLLQPTDPIPNRRIVQRATCELDLFPGPGEGTEKRGSVVRGNGVRYRLEMFRRSSDFREAGKGRARRLDNNIKKPKIEQRSR